MVITAILLLTALSTKAQYSKMLLGERCPFDTAVAIEVETYRIESLKFALGDSLIKNMAKQLFICDSLRIFEKGKNEVNLSILNLKNEEIRNKENTILKLTNEMQFKQRVTWWDKNKKYFVFAAGFVTGGAIIHYINK